MDARAGQLVIRPAGRDEGELLRALTVASRSHWGHDPERFARWSERIAYPPEQLEGWEPYVGAVDGVAVGWVAVGLPEEGVSGLEELWVVPEWIGKGVGATLFRHAAERARALGARMLRWSAEPGAVSFYERMGARHVGETTSRSFAIVVPVMALEL